MFDPTPARLTFAPPWRPRPHPPLMTPVPCRDTRRATDAPRDRKGYDRMTHPPQRLPAFLAVALTVLLLIPGVARASGPPVTATPFQQQQQSI